MEPEERFTSPVTGPSYGWFTKLLAAVITGIVVVFVVAMIVMAEKMNTPMLLLMLGASLAMSATTYYIMTGQTTIDSKGVRQDWITGKSYAWDEIRKVRVLRLPMATRLVINTGKPPFKAVHAGSDELVSAFEEIVRIYNDPTRTGGM